jgi:hypothetical protein
LPNLISSFTLSLKFPLSLPACLVGGSYNQGMGIQGVLDMISLVWLEAMGVQHGWGKGIQERNSPASLPWVPPGNSAEIGNW